MKIFIILTFCLSVSIQATTYSQSTKINLSVRNQSVRDVLRSIEDQTNFRFFYNDEFTDLNKTVSGNFENKTVEEILAAVFEQSQVTYKILENNFIVITPSVVQQTKLSGTITDSGTGEALPGVNLIIEGTTIGTTSDYEGKFTIDIPNQGAVLVFSYIGYLTERITFTGQSNLSVQLSPDIKALDEVVVIGYGTQRKGDITSAVASVNSKDFLIGKMQDAAELIKGKIAGLTVAKSSGDPNAQSTIMLRGIATIEGNVQPLVLIDNIPGDLSSVSPENIESFNVLKDASASAIYGTRGSNGVIIITTKTGSRSEKMFVDYSGYASVSSFLKKAEFMSPSDIRHGLTSFNDDGWDTDWLKAVTRLGYTNNQSLSIRGGTKNMTYSGNITYRKENGTIKNSDNEEYKMQLDISQYFLNDMLKINFNMLKGIHSNSANTATSDGLANIYRQAVIHNPTSPIYDEKTGDYYEEFGRFQYYNPVEMLNELDGDYKREWTHLTGNITFEPIKNWQTNMMVSTQRSNANNSVYTTSKYYLATTTGYSGSASKSYAYDQNNYLDLTTRYSLTLNNHHFSLLGGYSYSDFEYDGFSAGNADFPNDGFLSNALSRGALLKGGKASMDSYKSESKLIAFFGRLTYNYADKYNLLFSLRRDGSTKFGANNKWGSFPSISAGWTISNEPFLKSVSFINNLKLRVGYGVTGVTPGSSYSSLVLFDYSSSYGNYLDADGNWKPSLVVSQNVNKKLRWETTSELNTGLDFSVLNNRISGSIDVYNRKTTDLIYRFKVPTPPNLFETTLANVGSLSNKGIEIMVSVKPIKNKDIEWTSQITASHNVNKLINLSNDLYKTDDYQDDAWAGDPISVPTHRIEIGKPIGNFWGLKTVGVTDEGLWLIEDPTTGNALPYSTSLNSNTYRQYLGSGVPKLYMGWNNTVSYKNFDLGIQLSGQFGFSILNEQRMFYENNSIQYNRLKSAADLVYGKTKLSTSQAQAFVSYYIEKGDFVKFDNVTIGYTLKVPSLMKYFSDCRIYLSGQNLLVITGYKGLDPELGNDFHYMGNDFRDKYPTIRSFTLGLNVKF